MKKITAVLVFVLILISSVSTNSFAVSESEGTEALK